MKTHRIISAAICALTLLGLCSCGSMTRKIAKVPDEVEVFLVFDDSDIQRRFNDLDYGLRLSVTGNIDQNTVIDISELPSNLKTIKPKRYNISPSVRNFVEESSTSYIKHIGIPVSADMQTDYTLRLNIKEFKVRDNGSSPTATVVLEYELSDRNNSLVVPRAISTGRIPMNALEAYANGINRALTKALAGIDWDRIASQLKKHSDASLEKNRQVHGDGDTALESTVIRWYIVSAPQGADVSWRVISSTPEVKNTNSNYVGTTPYETTETFDIRGLTFNNSGNVQIEVTCEKPGYLPQKKRFNIRQAIEQKEISAKFNLVKED